MPWSIKKDDRCPVSEPYAVVKDDDALEGCHPSEAAAQKQQAALYAAEGRSMSDESEDVIQRPPRDNLVRSLFPGVGYRESADNDGSIGILFGHLAVWDQWTEINSVFEGRFMERVSNGSFNKYLKEQPAPKVLLNHGSDPHAGDKPLGPPSRLEPDDIGMYYEVPLLDTSYNRDILPGAKAGLYGSSFRFSVMKEDFKRNAAKSPYNPEGLPERTILEATLPEFGPVTFPAYAGATSGVRSETDDYIRRLLVPEFDEIREVLKALNGKQALPTDGAGATHSDEGSSVSAATPRFRSQEEFLQWMNQSTQS